MLLRHARRAHVGLGYVVAVAAITFAIVLGLVSLALPLIAAHPARVQAWLEHRTGQPVSFRGVGTRWTRLGPLIQLQDLRVGRGRDAVVIGDAELLASVYRGLLPGHAFTELRLRGLALTLVRGDDGTWQVRGIPGQEKPGADPFAALERLGELHVIGGRLAVVAPAYGINATVPRIDVRLRVDGPRVRAGVRAWPRRDGSAVDAVLDFDRASGNGRAYAGAARVELADWSALLQAGGVRVASGHGGARAWADLRGNRITRLVAQGGLDRVALDGARLDGRTPRLVFDRLDVLGGWQAGRDGWRATLPRLRLEQGDSKQALDGLALSGGGRFSLDARDVDIAPLLQAAALTDRLPAGTRRWIRNARPSGLVQALQLRQARGGAVIDARLASVGFARVGSAPGLQGLAGRIRGGADGVEFDFDAHRPVRFSWPQAFGPDHVVRLDGRAVAWPEGAGWQVATPALRIGGDGYAANVRGGLRWQGDGTRPWIDLAADVEPTRVPVARRFWVRHLMAPHLVQWLDAALVGGRLQNGRALIVGDLDDWPFRKGEGRFEARARIIGATLKFQPDWPAAQDVDAEVAFAGNGFQIDGHARIGAIALPALHAGIDDYASGALTVTAHGVGDAGALLDLVRASPLRQSQPETLAALSAKGPAQVDFRLGLPLGRPEPMTVAGEVALDGAMLADRRWNLRFEQVRGSARYDRNGFSAADLAVRHEGQPGRLGLRAGIGHVRDARNVFEGGVDAAFDIDDLLARAPEMAWLAPHVAGRSTWTVGVAVPAAVPGAPQPARLQLRSNLIGTSLDLPAPLLKPASQALAASVDTPLPMGSGEVVVGLGNLATVRARSVQGRTGVRVVLGRGDVGEPPSLQGLVATGQAAQLDALEWVAFARGGTGGGKGGLPLQRVDITAQRMALLGGVFADTRLQVSPVPAGLLLRADGAALSGSATIPAGDGAITARFARVHWKGMADMSKAASAVIDGRPRLVGDARQPGTLAMDFDPASIPPLSVDIDDLRMGSAQLGSARLRSRPAGNGMRLDQFSARGRGHRIDASGEWSGRGPSLRTRLAASVVSDDFGTLLQALGLGGQLGEGKGMARFEATWPGAPTDFQAGSVQGSLAVDVKNGHLLEVEPGAGRVLGLLSLAQLPRRLTLDFGDFFSRGFAFNRLWGNVRLGGGFARSDDLAIRGPAADIDIRGAANLRQQTFDQTIEVRPRSGNLLTAVGALAGGPVGAAIGAAANAVLSRPLGQIGAKTYRVTGPWAEPKVEVMSRSQSRAAAIARVPAG